MDQFQQAYMDGLDAREKGGTPTDNPYDGASDYYLTWRSGYYGITDGVPDNINRAELMGRLAFSKGRARDDNPIPEENESDRQMWDLGFQAAHDEAMPHITAEDIEDGDPEQLAGVDALATAIEKISRDDAARVQTFTDGGPIDPETAEAPAAGARQFFKNGGIDDEVRRVSASTLRKLGDMLESPDMVEKGDIRRHYQRVADLLNIFFDGRDVNEDPVQAEEAADVLALLQFAGGSNSEAVKRGAKIASLSVISAVLSRDVDAAR